MPRSKRDDLKRKVAQATVHCAQAVLDINEVFDVFSEAGKPEAEYLKQSMILIAQVREGLLAFAKMAWEMDEERLMRAL